MLGGMEVKPEQHRYPFLASLLCIPSQDAIIENEGAAQPAEDDGRRMREARGLARMSDDAIAATAAALVKRLPPEGWRVATDAEGRDYSTTSGEVRLPDTSNVPDSDDIQGSCCEGRSTGLWQFLAAKAPRSSAGSSRRASLPRSIKEDWPDATDLEEAACASEKCGGRRRARRVSTRSRCRASTSPSRVRTPPSPQKPTHPQRFQKRTTPRNCLLNTAML